LSLFFKSTGIYDGKTLTVKVIIDTNFLFIPSQFQVNIFEELMTLLNQHIDLVMLSPTYQELLKISKQGSPKLRRHALLALKLAEKCRLVHIETNPEEPHDDLLVRVAKKWNCPVATNDRKLRKKLREENVPTIFLRQGAFLELEGIIQ